MGAVKKVTKVSEEKKQKNYLNGIPVNPVARAKFFSQAINKMMAKRTSEDELSAQRTKKEVLSSILALKPDMLCKITSVDKYLKTIASQLENLNKVSLLTETDFTQMCLKFKKEARFNKSIPTADKDDLFFMALNKMINAYRKDPKNPRYSDMKCAREIFKHIFNNNLKDEVKKSKTQTRKVVEIDFSDIDWELRENSLTPLERISDSRLNTRILSLMRTCEPREISLLNTVLMTFTGEPEVKIKHAIKALKLDNLGYINEIKNLFTKYPDLKEELEDTSLNKDIRCDNISISVLGLHSYSQSAITNISEENYSNNIVSLKAEPCYSFKHKDGSYFGTVEVIVAEKNVVVNCGPVKSIDQARSHLQSEVKALLKRSQLKVA